MRLLTAAAVIGLLSALGVAAQEVYVDNVVVLLDASGSMNDVMRGGGIRKITAAKQAIRTVLQTLPPSTHVGLLVFGGGKDWAYALGPRNDAALLAAVDGLSARGGTPLGEYMKKGADRLLEARQAQHGYGTYRLLIVTDGEANDARLVERYTPEIVSRGITTDVIGVDMARDHTLATRVHTYRRANDPAALQKAIQDVFAEVGKASDGSAGQDVFGELAGFPTEAALGMISALLASGNHPIGRGADPVAVAVAVKPRPAGSPPPVSPAPPPRGGSGRGAMIVMVVVVMIIVCIVRSRR